MSYFKALGDAANSQNFSIQPGLNDLGTAVKAVPSINQGEVDAAVGFFGDIAKLAGNILRERELRKLIDQGEPKAQNLISTLNRAVPDNLSTQLDAEKTRLGGSFSSFLADSGINPPDPVDSICQDDGPKSYPAASGTTPYRSVTYLDAVEYCRQSANIGSKEKALDAYKASLKTASDALTELASSKARLGSKELAQNLFSIGNKLNDDVNAVKKAFSQ